MLLELLVRNHKPEREVDDAVHVTRLPAGGIEHRERALDDLRLAVRVRIGEQRDGEIAAPRQTVALHAVDQEVAHAQPKRAQGHLPHPHLAFGSRKRHAVDDIGDLLDDADGLRRIALEPEVAQGERERRAPMPLLRLDHLVRLLEVLGFLVERLRLGLPEEEKRTRLALGLDIADRLLPDVEELAVAAQLDFARDVLLQATRLDRLGHLEELAGIADLHLERLHVRAHVAQNRRLVRRRGVRLLLGLLPPVLVLEPAVLLRADRVDRAR